MRVLTETFSRLAATHWPLGAGCLGLDSEADWVGTPSLAWLEPVQADDFCHRPRFVYHFSHFHSSSAVGCHHPWSGIYTWAEFLKTFVVDYGQHPWEHQ